MITRKCDICKKQIKDHDEKITAGLGWRASEMCLNCGKPILNFLLKKALVSKSEIDKLK